MLTFSNAEEQWFYFDIAKCIEHVPFLFEQGGHPRWFADGTLHGNTTQYDLLVDLIQIGGIPAATALLSFPRLPAAAASVVLERNWHQVESSYAIAVKSAKFVAPRRHSLPFERHRVEWRPESGDVLRGLDFHDKVVDQLGLPVITEGARRAGVTGVMLFVWTENEAADVRAVLSGMVAAKRNQFGSSLDQELVKGVAVISMDGLLNEYLETIYFLHDRPIKRLAQKLKNYVESLGLEPDVDASLDIVSECFGHENYLALRRTLGEQESLSDAMIAPGHLHSRNLQYISVLGRYGLGFSEALDLLSSVGEAGWWGGNNGSEVAI